MAAKLDYTSVVAKAKEMQAAQRRRRHERGEEPGASWCALPDWMKLTWFCEAAAELGMEL
jgi:hypothetical protein